MINTVHDLLLSLKNQGIAEIEPFLQIQHVICMRV